MAVPKKVADRFAKTVKGYQSILQQQKARDVSEADTVTIVKDILSDVFGYDKYADLTSEHAIRGTYCDLAVKLDGKLSMLIEVKAIGTDLKENHVKQAIDYAANQGCDWVALTNGISWHMYHVIFKKPIDKQLIASFDFIEVNPKKSADVECLYLVTREGFSKSALSEYRDRKEATSRYMLAAVVMSDPVVGAVRRELRRVSDMLVDADDITKMLREEVLKRDAIEGQDADAATKRVQRKSDRSIIQTSTKQGTRSKAQKSDVEPKPDPAPSVKA